MRSMTGFAQGRVQIGDIYIAIMFRSLNHRFLDISFKGTGITPRFEKLIKEIIRGKVFRGKFEVVFNLFDLGQKRFNIQFNETLMEEILDRLLPVKDKYEGHIDLSMDFLLKIPMIFHLEYFSDDFEESDSKKIREYIEKIFAEFLASRESEGKYIQESLLGNIKQIEKSLKYVKKNADNLEKDLFNKYKERMGKILQEYEMDEKRIMQEAAILAEKNCINEEINRLETHCKRLKDLVKQKKVEIKGKEADFLSQEMQRETYTIASKTDSMEIHQHILEIRREIEKIKQQVQNVE